MQPKYIIPVINRNQNDLDRGMTIEQAREKEMLMFHAMPDINSLRSKRASLQLHRSLLWNSDAHPQLIRASPCRSRTAPTAWSMS